MKRLALIALACGLAACSGADSDAPSSESSAAAVPSPGADSDEGIYPDLVLAPLQAGDDKVVTENMSAAGACSFRDDQGQVLLTAGMKANSPDAAESLAVGVVRPGGTLTKLTADKSDMGYVERGPALRGGDVTLLIRRGEEEAKAVAGGAREWSARVVLSDAEGNKRRYTVGTWRCGE